jgi:hypothetical protein
LEIIETKLMDGLAMTEIKLQRELDDDDDDDDVFLTQLMVKANIPYIYIRHNVGSSRTTIWRKLTPTLESLN